MVLTKVFPAKPVSSYSPMTTPEKIKVKGHPAVWMDYNFSNMELNLTIPI